MFLNEEKNKKHQVNEDIQEIQEYFQKISSEIHQKELDEIADVVRDAKQVILLDLELQAFLENTVQDIFLT